MNARLEKHAAEMRLRSVNRRFEELLRSKRTGQEFADAWQSLLDEARADYELTGKEPKECPARILDALRQESFAFDAEAL